MTSIRYLIDITENNYMSEQTTALIKLLELGKEQIENGHVKTMKEVFEELDNPV